MKPPNWLRFTASFLCLAAMIRPDGPSLSVAEEEPGSRASAANRPVAGKLVEGAAGYKYLCFLPNRYDSQPKFWPTIVFLHGATQKEDLEMLKRIGPIRFALEQKNFPFIVVAPATGRGWDIKLFDKFLRKIQRQFRVDRNRIYLTGISMGGHATWRIACAYPHRFAAIAPVCGAGNPRHAAELLRHLAIWVIHGQNDTVVPVELARGMIRALEKVGGKLKCTIHPDRGHDVFIPAYDDAKLYVWFFKQRRR